MSKLQGQATQEQISEWKKNHPKIFTYTVDNKICYFKPVDRNTYSLAASKIASAGPAKFNETIVSNIWLGGCEEIKKEDKYFFGLIDHVEGLMDKQKGELGEL